MERDLRKEALAETNMITDTLLGLGARLAARRLKAMAREANKLADMRGEVLNVDPKALVERGMRGVQGPEDHSPVLAIEAGNE